MRQGPGERDFGRSATHADLAGPPHRPLTCGDARVGWAVRRAGQVPQRHPQRGPRPRAQACSGPAEGGFRARTGSDRRGPSVVVVRVTPTVEDNARGGQEAVKQEWLSTKQLAEEFEVPVATVHTWRATGRAPRAARVGKHLRFAREDIDAWIETLMDPPREGRDGPSRAEDGAERGGAPATPGDGGPGPHRARHGSRKPRGRASHALARPASPSPTTAPSSPPTSTPVAP
jgi:excisionase family DNA binding protein